MEVRMSLPLPVFRLDARSEMPFEPLCELAPGDAFVRREEGLGLLVRLRQWLGQTRAPRLRDIEVD
jgi:hypothetical protein